MSSELTRMAVTDVAYAEWDSSMNAERWARVKELFHAALDRGPVERDAFLLNACQGDADAVALRAEVSRLLAAHVAAGTFIEPTTPDSPQELKRTIGKYEVE